MSLVLMSVVDRLIAASIKATCRLNDGYRLKAYYSVVTSRLGAYALIQRNADLPFAVFWFSAEEPGFSEGTYYATEDQALAELDYRSGLRQREPTAA